MKNAVIYARYSSDAQKETSITDQLRDCRKYAQEQGYTIVHEYCDEAATGKNDEREQFQQMLLDSAKELFEVVIVWKLDRFARNRNESALNKLKLKKNGVRVLSAMEHIPEGPEGIILESVLEGLAEYYIYDLVEKTTRGQRGLALQAKHVGGHPLLGYTVDKDKNYVVDEYNAETVRMIFRMYASGNSYSQIIDTLNNQGRKTSVGKPFGKNSLHDILKNERYIGIYTYSKIPRKNGKRNSHAENGEDKLIRIPGGMPAIINNEDWERVQKRMKSNKKAPAAHKAKVDYLLSGKIFCGECGGAMVGESSGTTGKYNYYVCNAKKRLRNCKKKDIRKEVIESAVLDFTVNYVLSDEVCNALADMAHAESMKESGNKETIAAIKHQQLKNKAELDNMLNAIKAGIFTKSTKELLEQLEHEKDFLAEQLEEAKFFNSEALSKEAVSKWLSQFKKGNVNDVVFCHRLIETFINAVYVYDNGTVTVTYNWDSENEHKIPFSDLKQSSSAAPTPRNSGFSPGFGGFFIPSFLAFGQVLSELIVQGSRLKKPRKLFFCFRGSYSTLQLLQRFSVKPFLYASIICKISDFGRTPTDCAVSCPFFRKASVGMLMT
ncbi:recombinase family protein [Caproicibacterium sp. XB1]|uniref:recombinase family protein n=1 Tax=Caproicibacterium sp. XB1 TaxID=3396405 RepID=UPI0039B6FB7E